MLLGVVLTPIVGIGGPTQLPGVESERRRVRGVRVGLHDVPREGAEYDAVAGPGTDPPHGADGASGKGVWQRARDIVADGPRGIAVHSAVVFVVSMIPLFCHLQTIATSRSEVERGVVVPSAEQRWNTCLVARTSRSADTRPITNEPHDRRAGVVRHPWG